MFNLIDKIDKRKKEEMCYILSARIEKVKNLFKKTTLQAFVTF